MVSIELMSDLYIRGSVKKGLLSKEDFLKMDILEKFFSLSKLKPATFFMKDNLEDNGGYYTPILGNFVISSKPDTFYKFDRIKDAQFKANLISSNINNIYAQSILFFIKAKEHIKQYKPGTLKNSIF
jgi:hypothetical protein